MVGPINMTHTLKRKKKICYEVSEELLIYRFICAVKTTMQQMQYSSIMNCKIFFFFILRTAYLFFPLSFTNKNVIIKI